MSALDDYLEAREGSLYAVTALTITMKADAAIAELQAEVAEWKNAAQQETRVVVHLKAELAELRDRKGRSPSPLA